MTDLVPLQPSDLRFLYDAIQPLDDFDSFSKRMLGPEWTHWVIDWDNKFAGILSLELIAPAVCSLHFSVKHKTIPGKQVRNLLVAAGKHLFRSGFKTLLANCCNREARVLAVACGMSRDRETETGVQFRLTAEEYFENPQRWEIK